MEDKIKINVLQFCATLLLFYLGHSFIHFFPFFLLSFFVIYFFVFAVRYDSLTVMLFLLLLFFFRCCHFSIFKRIR